MINSSTWGLLIKANAWQLMNEWLDAWQTAVIRMETGITFVSSVPSNMSSNEHTSNSEQQLAFSSRPIAGLADCVNYCTPEFTFFLHFTRFFLGVGVISYCPFGLMVKVSFSP